MTSDELRQARDDFSAWSSQLTLYDSREARMSAVERKIDEYITITGERPPAADLARLADAILHEELADRRPDKVTIEEYPILSDPQYKRRKYGGKRTKSGTKRREIPLVVASYHGTDGVDYGEQKRVLARRRDENSERKRKYHEFVREQPVSSIERSDER